MIFRRPAPEMDAAKLSLPTAAIAIPAAILPGDRGESGLPRLSEPGGRPALHSLDALASEVPGGHGAPAGIVYDGTPAERLAPTGVERILTFPLIDGKDVDRLIPRHNKSAPMHDAIKNGLPSLQPLNALVFRDGRGGSFVGLDVSARPDNAGRMKAFQAHEISTVKKILAWTRDLQILVREEEGRTPDLVVGGIVTELKSIHGQDRIPEHLAHANDQLLDHAQRHGLGPGAVVLDVLDPKKASRESVETAIGEFSQSAPAVGFGRVYVFSGQELQTYSAGRDGAFRRDAVPHAFQSNPTAGAGLSWVPKTLAGARPPNLSVVKRELTRPSKLLENKGIDATVTFYGSARILSPEEARANLAAVQAKVGKRPRSPEGTRLLTQARTLVKTSAFYGIAQDLAARIAREGKGKIAVVSGGGGGIMEAANRGAAESGGPSVGYNIQLPREQDPNPYSNPKLSQTFQHFTTRKISLRHGSMGLVFLPGGLGTLDELFEVLTLLQTGKMSGVPVVLLGGKFYWNALLPFLKKQVRLGFVAAEDLSLFTVAETDEQAWKAIFAPHARQ